MMSSGKIGWFVRLLLLLFSLEFQEDGGLWAQSTAAPARDGHMAQAERAGKLEVRGKAAVCFGLVEDLVDKLFIVHMLLCTLVYTRILQVCTEVKCNFLLCIT